MSNEFEPYNNFGKKSEFNVWEYHIVKDEVPPAINPQEALLAECEALRLEAKQQGYAQGMQQAQQEIEEKKLELLAWINLLQNPVQLLDETLIQELIQTVIWLSQYCIGVELSVNPDKLHDLMLQIKAELPSLRAQRVFAMHPKDVEWIKKEFSDKEIPELHKILSPDPALNKGDFYLRGDNSELDGRLQTRFSTLFAKYINKDNWLSSADSQD